MYFNKVVTLIVCVSFLLSPQDGFIVHSARAAESTPVIPASLSVSSFYGYYSLGVTPGESVSLKLPVFLENISLKTLRGYRQAVALGLATEEEVNETRKKLTETAVSLTEKNFPGFMSKFKTVLLSRDPYKIANVMFGASLVNTYVRAVMAHDDFLKFTKSSTRAAANIAVQNSMATLQAEISTFYSVTKNLNLSEMTEEVFLKNYPAAQKVSGHVNEVTHALAQFGLAAGGMGSGEQVNLILVLVVALWFAVASWTKFWELPDPSYGVVEPANPGSTVISVIKENAAQLSGIDYGASIVPSPEQ